MPDRDPGSKSNLFECDFQNRIIVRLLELSRPPRLEDSLWSLQFEILPLNVAIPRFEAFTDNG